MHLHRMSLPLCKPTVCPSDLCVQVPDVNGIIDRLLLFLGYEKDFVTAETLVQVGGWWCVKMPCKKVPASVMVRAQQLWTLC
jgi:hypothetical protein